MVSDKKLVVLQKINREKDILFGAFSNDLTKAQKREKWKEISELAETLGLVKGKPWQYMRDTVWCNWRKRTLARKHNARNVGAEGEKKCKYNHADLLILEILGTDSSTKELMSTDCFLEDVGNEEKLSVGEPDSAGNQGNLSTGVLSSTGNQGTLSTRALDSTGNQGTLSTCALDSATPASSHIQRKVSAAKKAKRYVTTEPKEHISIMTEEERKQREFDLQIEYLKLRNYKLKLEVLEIEKRLSVPPSQYTKDMLYVEK